MSDSLYDEILDEGEERASSLLKGAQLKAERILEEAKREAEHKAKSELSIYEERIKSLHLHEENEIKSEERLEELRRLDRLNSKLLERIRKKVASLSREEKVEILFFWAGEAIEGVGENRVRLSFPSGIMPTEKELEDLEKRVEEETHYSVKIEAFEDQRLKDFGVVATSEDRSISYSNTLNERIRRFRREIRKIIQDHETHNRQGQKG